MSILLCVQAKHRHDTLLAIIAAATHIGTPSNITWRVPLTRIGIAAETSANMVFPSAAFQVAAGALTRELEQIKEREEKEPLKRSHSRRLTWPQAESPWTPHPPPPHAQPPPAPPTHPARPPHCQQKQTCVHVGVPCGSIQYMYAFIKGGVRSPAVGSSASLLEDPRP